MPNALELQGMSPAERTEFERGLAQIETRWPRATVADLINHIDYAVRLIGIDHVGISSDFGGGGGIVGWSDAGETINVTRELVARGYSQTDIGKLWSGNLLRVWREAERVAPLAAALIRYAVRVAPAGSRGRLLRAHATCSSDAARPRRAPYAASSSDDSRSTRSRSSPGLAQDHAQRHRELRRRHPEQQPCERAVGLVMHQHVASAALVASTT